MENPPMLVFSAAKQPSFITLLIQYAINKQNNQGYVTMKFSVPDYHHPILAYWRKKSYQAVSIDVLKNTGTYMCMEYMYFLRSPFRRSVFLQSHKVLMTGKQFI